MIDDQFFRRPAPDAQRVIAQANALANDFTAIAVRRKTIGRAAALAALMLAAQVVISDGKVNDDVACDQMAKALRNLVGKMRAARDRLRERGAS